MEKVVKQFLKLDIEEKVTAKDMFEIGEGLVGTSGTVELKDKLGKELALMK